MPYMGGILHVITCGRRGKNPKHLAELSAAVGNKGLRVTDEHILFEGYDPTPLHSGGWWDHAPPAAHAPLPPFAHTIPLSQSKRLATYGSGANVSCLYQRSER